MTAYVSAAAGNWSTTTNFTPNGTPGIGDTLTLTHAITMDSSRTIGTSGVSGTAAITINAGGSLTLATGATLTLRGDLVHNNRQTTMNAGSAIVFDSSAAASPSTTKYQVILGTGHNQSSAKLVINGTSGSRCSISSNASGGNGWINDGTGPWLQGGQVEATYCDFTRVGDATNDAIRTSPTSSATFSLQNCTFTDCGRIGGTYNIGATCTYRLENVTFVNTQHSTNTLRVENASGYTSGTRTITGCVFDKNVSLYAGSGFVIGAENIFAGTVDATAGDWQSCTGSAFLDVDNLLPGGCSDSYLNAVGVTVNPHNLQPLASADATYEDLVFENHSALNATEEGDGILDPTPGTTRNYTVENCLVVPTATGRLSCSLFSLLGNANVRVAFNHNTGYVTANNGSSPNAGFFTVGETFNTATGQVTSCKSNIFAAASALSVYLLRNLNGSPNNDVVAAADCDYNSPYNNATGSEGVGYNTPMTGTPGAHDLVGQNPQFVDPTRTIATWDASLGGPGTQANAIAEMEKRNTPSFNANYTVANLKTYLREGFRPTNTAYRNAGHDGVTIGALEGNFAGVASLPKALRKVGR